MKRNDENISKESLSSIFNTSLEDTVKIIMNNDDIGIGALIKITEPDSYISDTYYSEVENNIIQNFNSSLESIIGQKIIDNTDLFENSSYKKSEILELALCEIYRISKIAEKMSKE